ncbi:hypothetical protein D3C86_1505490 [compost metagenome]
MFFNTCIGEGRLKGHHLVRLFQVQFVFRLFGYYTFLQFLVEVYGCFGRKRHQCFFQKLDPFCFTNIHHAGFIKLRDDINSIYITDRMECIFIQYQPCVQ